jgi:hypothetical protein
VEESRNSKQVYKDKDMLAILKEISKKVDGPLTTNRFIEMGGEPTIAIYIARFGSWAAACKKAKVKFGKGRSSYERRHTPEDLINYVRQYLESDENTGSGVNYDLWQRGVEGAPSFALLRQRLGNWNKIKEMAKK